MMEPSMEHRCLRCGRFSCPCTGLGDYVRAEGGCTSRYKKTDLAMIRCYSCHELRHTGCVAPSIGPPKPSCYNCGEGGHTADQCWKERPHAVRAERRRDAPSRGANDRRGSERYGGGYHRSSGGRGGSNDMYGGGGGKRDHHVGGGRPGSWQRRDSYHNRYSALEYDEGMDLPGTKDRSRKRKRSNVPPRERVHHSEDRRYGHRQWNGDGGFKRR